MDKKGGFTIWITGLPGSGKSKIADLLGRELVKRGYLAKVLDGGKIRKLIGDAIGFSKEQRIAHNKRLAFEAKTVNELGGISIVASVSPYKEIRESAKNYLKEMFEVFVKSPVEACALGESADFYKKAKSGELPNFTGITAPYEPPDRPAIVCETDMEDPEESVGKIITKLEMMTFIESQDTGEEYTPEDEKKVRERLQGLGYIE